MKTLIVSIMASALALPLDSQAAVPPKKPPVAVAREAPVKAPKPKQNQPPKDTSKVPPKVPKPSPKDAAKTGAPPATKPVSKAAPKAAAAGKKSGTKGAGAAATPRRNRATPQAIRRAQADETRERLRREELDRRWSFAAGLSGVGDTNIEHEKEAQSDVGYVVSGSAAFRRGLENGSLSAHYEIAQHQYSETKKWNRISQLLQGVWRHELSEQLRLRSLGEIALKGSADERELADRFTIVEQLDYAVSARDTISPSVSFRLKRYENDRERDSSGAYAGISYTHDWSKDHSLEIGYRYEQNQAESARHDYRRQTYDVAWSRPLGRGVLELEAKYKPQIYDRLVEVDGRMVRRRDRRFVFDANYSRDIGRRLTIEALYEYEHRTSNDADKEYTANLVSLTLLRRW